MKAIKLRIGAGVSLLAFVSSLVPVAAFATDVAACKSTCDDYKNAVVAGTKNTMSWGYLVQNCNQPPSNTVKPVGSESSSGNGSLSTLGVDFGMKSGDDAWDKCFSDLQAKWQTLGEHCAAIDIDDVAHTEEQVTLGFFGAAAAVCGLSCIADKSPYGPALRVACIVTGVASTLADIAGLIAVAVEGGNKIDGFEYASSCVAPLLSTAGTIATAASTTASNATQRQTDSCVAFAFMAAATAIKAGALVNTGNLAGEECDKILKYNSQTTVNQTGGGTGPTPSGGNSGPNGTSSQMGGGTGSGGGMGSHGGPLSNVALKELQNFPTLPHYAQATAGDAFGTLFKSINGKENMPAALQQAAGLSLNDLAGKLASGQSLSSIASGNPALESLAPVMSKIEKDVKDGNLKINGQSMASAGTLSKSGGGGAKTAASTSPFGMFGMKSPALSSDAPKEQAFAKTKKDLEPEGSDIWHEGFAGSIFQIVSSKLVKARERVDQLEWDSPLNRALVGLPAKKSEASRKTASERK